MTGLRLGDLVIHTPFPSSFLTEEHTVQEELLALMREQTTLLYDI